MISAASLPLSSAAASLSSLRESGPKPSSSGMKGIRSIHPLDGYGASHSVIDDGRWHRSLRPRTADRRAAAAARTKRVLSPHVGGVTRETLTHIAMAAASNVSEYLAGKRR